MAPLDTSDALYQVLTQMGWEPSKPGLHGFERIENGTFAGEEYISQLSKKLGKSTRWIYQMLQLRNEKPEVKNDTV